MVKGNYGEILTHSIVHILPETSKQVLSHFLNFLIIFKDGLEVVSILDDVFAFLARNNYRRIVLLSDQASKL